MFNTLFVHPLFNLLVTIYSVVADFGLAVIGLTVLVRLVLWPLVTRQLHNQRAVQELAPELAKIKAKAAGDRALEGQLTLELYKEREINPYASFLPLVIQLPIFFALYLVLQDIVKPGEIAKITYPFLQNLPHVKDIIAGTATFQPTLLGVVDLTKASAILAVLAALAQFTQTKQLTPKQQANDSQAQVMKVMLYTFPAITFVIGLKLPEALALYWLTSSLMAVVQQYLVLQRDVEELEEGVVVTTTSTATSPKAKPHRRGKGKGGKK
jgi:YidC/Oxa1 family membrane protein insertase